jgi:hypothetical protein
VAARVTVRGTPDGEFMGRPATGRSFTVTSVGINSGDKVNTSEFCDRELDSRIDHALSVASSGGTNCPGSVEGHLG